MHIYETYNIKRIGFERKPMAYKVVFEYDYNQSGKTWCSDIKTILEQVNLMSSFQNKLPVNLKTIEERLLDLHKLNWSTKIQSVSKLRTYRQFKNDFGTEKYLFSNLSKSERSHLAQFRCGILPLRLETGRFVGLSVEERICNLCNINETEDELHFLLRCTCYNELRNRLTRKAIELHTGFSTLNDAQKLIYLMENHYACVAHRFFNTK